MHRMNPIALVAHFCFELITPTIPGVFITRNRASSTTRVATVVLAS